MKFDPHILITPKYARWIISCLILLFSLLILWEFTSLFFNDRPKILPILENTKPKSKTTQSLDGDLKEASLFGVYVPQDLNEHSVKKSLLQVTLVGIILGEGDEDSHVIIKSSNGDEINYKIGDRVSGALIKRITADGVLVERDGAIESISLPKESLSFDPISEPLKEEKLP